MNDQGLPQTADSYQAGHEIACYCRVLTFITVITKVSESVVSVVQVTSSKYSNFRWMEETCNLEYDTTRNFVIYTAQVVLLGQRGH